MLLKYFSVTFYLALQWTMVKSQKCTLVSNGISPIVVKDFGLRKIITHSFGRFELEQNEELLAFCPTAIRMDGNHHNHRAVELLCDFNGPSYKFPGDSNFRHSYPWTIEISCSGKEQLQLFESERVLPNCTKYNSLAVGIQGPPIDIKSAGICYDLDALSLKYILFIVHSPKHDQFLPSKAITTASFLKTMQPKRHDLPVNLDKQLNGIHNYFTFMSAETFEGAIERKRAQNKLLDSVEFAYASIVHNVQMREELKAYDNILSVVWWRNLQRGNWQLFLHALANRAKAASYIASLGTSGILTGPTHCNSTGEFLNIANDDGTTMVKTPQYIWAYLKPLPANESDEFVVVAHNSPFLKISLPPICTDVCDEIGWLATGHFKITRLMPSLGVIVCCRPDEAALVLDNFPRSLSAVPEAPLYPYPFPMVPFEKPDDE